MRIRQPPYIELLSLEMCLLIRSSLSRDQSFYFGGNI